jgi:hypothetical protein
MRDDTTLVEDAAAALHVALHRAEAWARLVAARGVLLGEASVALAALATFEGSYTYGDQRTIQATTAAGQVCCCSTIQHLAAPMGIESHTDRERIGVTAYVKRGTSLGRHAQVDLNTPFFLMRLTATVLLCLSYVCCRQPSPSAASASLQQHQSQVHCSRCGTTTPSHPMSWVRCTRVSASC